MSVVSCDNINNKKALKLWNSISKWADTEIVNKNIQAPYQAAMSMFESRFHIPMDYAVLLSDAQGGAFLTRGNINAFIEDLYSYAKRVDSGKFSEFEVAEGFMVGTVLGKRDPVLAKTIKSIREVVDNDKKRSSDLNLKFKKIIDGLRGSSDVGGIFSERRLNASLKKHRQLELDYIKALDSGVQKDIDEKYEVLTKFERDGSVKTFTEFIDIIETKMPKAILAKYNDERIIARINEDGSLQDLKGIKRKERKVIEEARERIKEYDNGTKLVRLTDDESLKYFRQLNMPEDITQSLIDYNNLMTDSYSVLRAGINAKIDVHIKRLENRKGFATSVNKLEELKDKMRGELMPKYKEDGYFPHFTRQLNAQMMDNMMKHFDELDDTSIDMKHTGKSIEDIIDNISIALPNYAKARDDNNKDYSMNFIDVVQTYINDVNKFNTQAFLKKSFIESLTEAKSMYTKENEYSSKIVDMINSLYGSVNGEIQNSGSLHELKKALLSYQFTNKLGFSVRSAARNATQYLMNYATFGYRAVQDSRAYLKENKASDVLGLDLDEFLRRENLFMETSEALIESGISPESARSHKVRRMDENGKIVYSDEENFLYKGVKIFGSNMSKLANWSSGMHRAVENKNRKLTAEIAFAQVHKLTKKPKFQKYLTKLAEEQVEKTGKGTVQSVKNKMRRDMMRAYAKNMVILNHFDYNAYAKAKNMREGIGQFMFQFQHYGMEFLERNYSIYKEFKGDLSALGEDNFSNWLKDARGVHKMMNVSTAYFLAPALLSYIAGYNQTLVEHTGKEILEDLYHILFTDYDDPEQLEKLNKEFYGKGLIGSKLGPTFGTIFDIGIATELINADSEYLDNILITAGDFGLANKDLSSSDMMGQYIRLINQMAGRTYDRYVPMTVKTPYGLGAAAFQEMTFYPTNKEQGSLYRDLLEEPLRKSQNKFIKDYYFDKLEEKGRLKKKKYSGLPVDIQNSLRELERAGKR